METHQEYQYLNALARASNGILKPNRTDNKTRSFFGNLMRFNLYENGERILPLMTTKNMSKSSEIIFAELEFFIKGQTNTNILSNNGVKIWDANTSREYLDSRGLYHLEEGDAGCFVAGTKVLTDTGYKNIEDITINNKLYTHKNNYQNINNIQIKTYSGELYRIRTKYNPRDIICTSEHPFMCYDSSGRKWISAEKLSEKDLLGIKINSNSIVPEFVVNDALNNSEKIVLNSLDQWFMLGYFAIRGEIIDGLIYIKLKYNCTKAKKIISNVLDIEYHYDYLYKLNDLRYTKILENIKNIPEWVQSAPIKYIEEFLYGVRLAESNNIKLETTYGIQMLNYKLGYFTDIQLVNNGYNIKTVTDPENCIIDQEIAWIGISDINHYKINNLKVYNFEVSEDNSYTVAGINVHNCIYGFQWRHFNAKYMDCDTDYNGQGYDQLQNVIDEIKNNPYSRRLLVSAWNPLQLDQMCLPPCHVMYQFNVQPDENSTEMKPRYLDCIIYQRSADLPLGVPFNIASYAALTHIVSDIVDLIPNELVYVTGDNHIYENQLELIKKQISRKPFPFPKLVFTYKDKPLDINNYKAEYLKITDYEHHTHIKYPFSV